MTYYFLFFDSCGVCASLCLLFSLFFSKKNFLFNFKYTGLYMQGSKFIYISIIVQLLPKGNGLQVLD